MAADKSNKDKLLGLLGIGLGMGGLLLLGYLLWGEMPGLVPAAMAVPPTVRLSAHGEAPTRVWIDLWVAHGQARAAAQAWAEDAQLVSASTQWQAANNQALLAGAGNWSFVFYSAASSSVLDVVVSTGAAQVVNQTRVWGTPKALAQGTWQAGPRDALLVFLAYGGRAFLDEHPQAVVDLHLAEGDGERAVWTIVALAPGDRSLLSLVIDADTGQVFLAHPDHGGR